MYVLTCQKLTNENGVYRVPLSDKGHEESQSSEKMEYLSRQFLAELGLSQWRSREFWGMLTMFLLVFFIRIYLHYVAQWIYLKAIEIPINKSVHVSS